MVRLKRDRDVVVHDPADLDAEARLAALRPGSGFREQLAGKVGEDRAGELVEAAAADHAARYSDGPDYEGS